MGAMNKLRTAELDIAIEWRRASTGATSLSTATDVLREDVLELARALGRLAARRDIAEANARRADQCPSSAGMITYNDRAGADLKA